MPAFYKYMMQYRGANQNLAERRLADWMYHDHDFPKQSESYDEISQYLEWTSPFNEAITLFDRLWEDYLETKH